LYVDDDVWQALQIRARQSGSTMSELVRKAIRETYMNPAADRKAAMLAVVGLWKDRGDIGDSTEYVRALRRESRLDRLK